MKEKKSSGSCRAQYARQDEDHQYLDMSVDEAARLIAALQNTVGTIIGTERRGSESDVRLWLHSHENETVTVTVYQQGK